MVDGPICDVSLMLLWKVCFCCDSRSFLHDYGGCDRRDSKNLEFAAEIAVADCFLKACSRFKKV